MKKEFPSRYYMEGIAEANIIGMAAGMAMDGFVPYVNTIATFITRRCYEQVAVDLCLHDLPVRLIGNGGGYVYAPLGPDARGDRGHRHHARPAAHDGHRRVRRRGDDPADGRHARLAASDLHPPRQGRRSGDQQARARLRHRQGDRHDRRRDRARRTSCWSPRALPRRRRSRRRARWRPTASAAACCTSTPSSRSTPTPSSMPRAKARLVVTVEEHSVIGGLGSAVLETLSDRITGACRR